MQLTSRQETFLCSLDWRTPSKLEELKTSRTPKQCYRPSKSSCLNTLDDFQEEVKCWLQSGEIILKDNKTSSHIWQTGVPENYSLPANCRKCSWYMQGSSQHLEQCFSPGGPQAGWILLCRRFRLFTLEFFLNLSFIIRKITGLVVNFLFIHCSFPTLTAFVVCKIAGYS